MFLIITYLVRFTYYNYPIIIKNSFIVFILLASHLLQAQFIKEKFLDVQIGYGLSVPFNSVAEIVDDGFFLQGELV